MGVVYHTHYLDYFEAARTEALRELGLAYKTLEEAGFQMPVIDASLQYKRPALYDDLLCIRAHIKEAPRTRIRIDYEVYRDKEQDILVTGHVSLCFMDLQRQRPVIAPPQVNDLFKPIFSPQNG